MNRVEDLFQELCAYIKKNGNGQMACTGHREGMEFDILIKGWLEFDPAWQPANPAWFNMDDRRVNDAD